MSFIKGVFPENLKIVKAIPIHKGGSTQDMNNFCLISLLSIFDKILKTLMHKRLYEFLENSNVVIALVSTSAAHTAVCNRVVNENMINVVVDSLPQDQKCFPTIYNMTMVGELQFGRPLADHHFDPSPGPKYQNLAKLIQNPKSASKMPSDDI